MIKQILIVDDQSEVRELVSVTLEVEPYDILQAENGQQALDMAASHIPDLILLDVMMPDGMNGLEVCRRIKENPALRDIPVIMLTARGQEVDVEEGYAAGADEYFTKPFSPLELITKVEQFLA